MFETLFVIRARRSPVRDRPRPLRRRGRTDEPPPIPGRWGVFLARGRFLGYGFKPPEGRVRFWRPLDAAYCLPWSCERARGPSPPPPSLPPL